MTHIGPGIVNETAGGVFPGVIPGTGSSFTFTQFGITPVLLKGSTYDGWVADALAAPGFCNDGTQFVMTVSFWSIALSKWASGFFTSPDCKTWSYVTSSLRTPQGSDYILGNGGVAFMGGLYYFAYAHYPSGGTPIISVDSSPDLVTWTNRLVSLSAGNKVSDVRILFNSSTNKLEIWNAKITTSIPDIVQMWSSSDGIAWTKQGDFYAIPSYHGNFPGAPHAFYWGGKRYMVLDQTPAAVNTPARYVQLLYQQDTDTLWWYNLGTAVGPDATQAWKSVQTFDGQVLVADIGDGLGSCPRLIFAGGDNSSGTDNTNSSIGLASATSGTSFSAGAGPYLHVTDNFTRADGALGANWTTTANINIVSNKAKNTSLGAGNDFALYTGQSLGNSQSATITLGALPANGFWSAAIVRATDQSHMYFALLTKVSGTTLKAGIYKNVGAGGVLVVDGLTVTKTMAIGDVFELSVVDSTLVAYYNGNVQAGPVVDTSIPSGGFAGFGLPENQAVSLSNFVGAGY